MRDSKSENYVLKWAELKAKLSLRHEKGSELKYGMDFFRTWLWIPNPKRMLHAMSDFRRTWREDANHGGACQLTCWIPQERRILQSSKSENKKKLYEELIEWWTSNWILYAVPKWMNKGWLPYSNFVREKYSTEMRLIEWLVPCSRGRLTYYSKAGSGPHQKLQSEPDSSPNWKYITVWVKICRTVHRICSSFIWWQVFTRIMLRNVRLSKISWIIEKPI